MIDRQQLLSDLQALLRSVEADLLARSEDAELPEVSGWLKAEYDAAKKAGRTAQTFKAWVDDFVTQVAAAWVLSCVFVRYLEDNALVDPPRIAGPVSDADGGQSRLKRARDEYDHWVQNNRGQTDREYLLDIFSQLDSLQAAGEVFGPHNPLNALPNWLSGDAARAMLAFFQKVDSDTGEITHDFTDASGDTRFLGDLYQDLSEAARKKYALLQTPDFVEEFILDRTLEPALDEFGLTPAPPSNFKLLPSKFRMIDPACGSGHFLLGAFPRILDRWQRKEPGEYSRVLIQRALDSIHGVDVNPYAIAIARFRLLLAALAACDCKKLKDAPKFEINLACGDSLWHAPLRGNTGSASRGQVELPEFSPEAASETQQHTYFAEDAARLQRILAENQYHCVVANPPYIVPKDRALNQDYRARYESCHMKYSLAVPFMERIFRLAVSSTPNSPSSPAGYTGQITANSFMKREFGKKLIEQFLPTVDLTHVIDTSGAYIPGHGTPTTILFGRHREPVASTIRTVMGIKGEPATPDNPADGLVWTAIVDQIDQPGSESDFVSAGDSERERFETHPWSIGGGGAAELKEQIENSSTRVLKQLVDSIGFHAISGEDEVFIVPNGNRKRFGLLARKFVVGDLVRDWSFFDGDYAIVPYDYSTAGAAAFKPADVPWLTRYFWPYRTPVRSRSMFGKSVEEHGFYWYEYMQFIRERATASYLIAYAEVATHNHFVLDRGGKVFKQTAPVIKLPAEIESDDGSRRPVTEDDHLALLGLLNSSTACFWMKQVCHQKQMMGGDGIRIESKAKVPYAFNATALGNLPIPDAWKSGALRNRLLELTKRLDAITQRYSELAASHVINNGEITATAIRSRWHDALDERACLRSEQIFLQEQIDFVVYRMYDLVDAKYVGEDVASLKANITEGVRPFCVAEGKNEDGFDVPSAVPEDWQTDLQSLWKKRIELIKSNRELRLIESAMYKRRWIGRQGLFNHQRTHDELSEAAQPWLTDRLESYFDFDGRMNDEGTPTAKVETELVSIARLADIAAADEAFMEVAAVYRDDPAFNVPKLVEDLVKAENVPLLPILRYKPAGLRKREQWEETWELQRKEDRLADDLRLILRDAKLPEDQKEFSYTEVPWSALQSFEDKEGKPLNYLEIEQQETFTFDQLHRVITRWVLGDIPVPPKYKSSDFISTGGARYWALRGKLDVPKERWISFPHCPGSDGTLMICWAGYDHLQQALAIAAHYQTIKEDEGGAEDPRLVPLLACIAELLPWLRQWHSDIDPTYGTSMADYFDGFLSEEARALNQTLEEIKAWQPPARTTGRRRSAT
ncbi:SAM-dependent methyltransferase [Rhodopirellula sp. SM50]|nr:BREX-2 system adenine-specific DNA-methyltransferase PglX [Rhodopirellula sp. SM50]PAY16337.1 SAM-dependent methyltransferase [Rhodopirellula sp. SM50]